MARETLKSETSELCLLIMSISELKKTADSLSTRERQWLKSYLLAKERSDSPDWKARITQKKALLADSGVSSATYKRRLSRPTRAAS